MPADVFVLGLDDFNRELLDSMPDAQEYRFHGLLDVDELVGAPTFDMDDLLGRAQETMASAAEPPDGLFTFWDFPASTMAPVLRRRFGLRGPSLESTLRCEHKYWSRLEQAEVVPELVPAVAPVHPFADDPTADLDLAYPFWLKPVRAHSSYLGFHIEDDEDLRRALERTRERLPRFAEPFDRLLEEAELPPKVQGMGGHHCIAEQIISGGSQCTLEGYVLDGDPRVYGIVDSLRVDEGSSFSRYQYPSLLPGTITSRMIDVAVRVMRHIGFDDGAFNIEFFHDERTDRMWLLEINSRPSKSHFPLFQMVDGIPNVQVAAALSVGARPALPHRGLHAGDFAMAAKFMLRRFRDGVVRAMPDDADVRRVRQEMPGTQVKFRVEPGQRLGQLEDQDSYSYEYAVVFLGGRDQAEIETKYERCLELLEFDFADVG